MTLPRPYSEPRDPIEAKLAAIWAKALNLDCVGVDDDFSDLGGDSFDAETVQTAIENEMGVRIPLSAMIETPTVALFAKLIERLRVGGGGPSRSLTDTPSE
jgi:acyl carrier protein